jgi:hypothetical protein
MRTHHSLLSESYELNSHGEHLNNYVGTTGAQVSANVMMPIYTWDNRSDIVCYISSIFEILWWSFNLWLFDLDHGYLGVSSHDGEMPRWIHNEDWNNVFVMRQQCNYGSPNRLVAYEAVVTGWKFMGCHYKSCKCTFVEGIDKPHSLEPSRVLLAMSRLAQPKEIKLCPTMNFSGRSKVRSVRQGKHDWAWVRRCTTRKRPSSGAPLVGTIGAPQVHRY